ncbi:MAG: hypothetical protein GWN99_16365 [Gemmatimonadetes bacterium]|uniref:Uncharacterized protein n=1 Tax=Candidatus Kutchimonas denitrificans TaxID=3056748 RepID=A0AAE4Z686_9BACT|nr:hypothetical protein [Gemmatimonadota bacterium]NIR74363.1 hypothetical protein [Candidatus Kutchimonas denitrificans]NIS02614.1 hypothetical protein [Gemmatimonadota bacterium]NIT68489.1 hypothetical protein [Gemmatimonadota bacterium]NIU51966.1 hypothetical protein [Gemmatimonadota bacterium]
MLLKGMNRGSRSDRALPLDARLQAIASRIPTAKIDELWVFPPLPNREITSEFVVLVCFDGDEERRRILTAQMDAEFTDPDSDEVRWVQRVREQGTAPQRWLSDIPDRLLGRLADAGTPEIIEVGGAPEAWAEAVARFADGNGRGNGNGGGNGNGVKRGVALGTAQVDSALKREISFSTIIESSVFDDAPDHQQPQSL